MTRQVSLSVNNASIPIDYFVQSFIDHTMGGMMESLEGTGQIGKLDISIEAGGQLTINLNNAQVPANPFVSKIVKNTILGMVSSLKGVGEVKTLKLTVTR